MYSEFSISEDVDQNKFVVKKKEEAFIRVDIYISTSTLY